MSGEFGTHGNGHFDYKFNNCISDCLEDGQLEITKLWGNLLESMRNITHDISYAEADDIGEFDLILQSIKDIDGVQAKLDVIKKYLDIYEKIIDKLIVEKSIDKNHECLNCDSYGSDGPKCYKFLSTENCVKKYNLDYIKEINKKKGKNNL